MGFLTIEALLTAKSVGVTTDIPVAMFFCLYKGIKVGNVGGGEISTGL